MLFRSDVFWQVKGFDANIFLYCEEYDMSRKLKQIGKCCVVFPDAKFLHLKGASTTRNKYVRRELYISRIYTYRKYHNLFLSTIYRIIILIKMLVNPKRWYMLSVPLKGEALSMSMKHRLS